MVDHARDTLEAEYCPPVDPSLFSAIVSEYDLGRPDHVQAVRTTLDPIKESALLEEASGFDPSGTGGAAGADWQQLEEQTTSSPDDLVSRETDLSSLSNGVRSLDLNHPPPLSVCENAGPLDEDAAVQCLLEVFKGHVTRSKAQYVLRKCNGNVDAAIDEMLNHVHFGEDGSAVPFKGIDAFSEDHVIRRSRKGKPRGKNARLSIDGRTHSSSAPPADGTPHTTNRWRGEDVEFIVTRTSVSKATVTSIYHDNGASLHKTIDALLKADVGKMKENHNHDAQIIANAANLNKDFPALPTSFALALCRLTHPSTAAAHELADAWSAQPTNAGLHVIPNYVPLSGLDDPVMDAGASRPPLSVAAPFTGLSGDAELRAATHAAQREQLRQQASAAYRKAKSDRLMGGAAAYYGEESRKSAAAHRAAAAVAMDRRAAAQASPAQLDLHGIDVLNAGRIARAYVEAWWAGLGEARVNGRVGAADRSAGYRVVVGRGTHSEGGKGKLGPAVSKVLNEAGWRIEAEGAAILVKGRAR